MVGHQLRSNSDILIMQAILNFAYLSIAVFALLGALDFIKESWAIFKEALRKLRERNARE